MTTEHLQEEAFETEATSGDISTTEIKPQGESNPTAALALGVLASAALAACGEGDDAAVASSSAEGRAQAMATASLPPVTYYNAWRFLSQATMGPTEDEINALVNGAGGYQGWLNRQFATSHSATPVSGAPAPGTYAAEYEKHSPGADDYLDSSKNGIEEGRKLTPPRPYGVIRRKGDNLTHFNFALWNKPLFASDQLRYRVVHALTQFLVISIDHNNIGDSPYKAAGYMDMLSSLAFTDFKTIIKGVATSPAMSFYLTFFANLPPEPGKRIPDQNFARELLQLFTIGLTKLNMDGSEVKVNGQTQMTTTPQDIAVLSNVFTGWSYEDRPYLNDDPRYPLTRDRTTLDYVDNATSASNATTGSKVTDELVWINDGKLHFYFSNGLQFRRSLRDLVPLRGDRAGYPQEIRPIGAQPNPGSIRIHPQDDAVIAQVKPASGKLTFLGKPFAMKTTPTESLDAALEIIFAHQNLAPFVAKQMIQHMVTSNPTPAYVQRVAVAFKKANWDMKTLITAILLDEEARLTTYANSPTFGRLREPFLRVLGMMRALGYSGCYTNLTNQTTDPTKARNLNHGPLCAPSVFNDFSPTYQYLGNESAKGEMAALGKVIPQMQIATETAVIAYINAVYEILNVGIVADMTATVETGDLWPLNVELTKLNTPLDMANFVNRKLFGNGMSTELKAAVQAAATGDTSKKRERLKAAIFTAVVSTEYLVQR